jgi:hypothetical protein
MLGSGSVREKVKGGLASEPLAVVFPQALEDFGRRLVPDVDP